MSATRAEDSSTAETTTEVSAWISPISEAIWPAAAWDSSASLRTSSATTAKPLPCSPARAASMAALSASRLVCSEMPVIVATMPPMRSDFSERRSMPVPTRPAASASDADRLRGLVGGVGALAGDALGELGGLGAAAGALGGGSGRAGGLLDGFARGLHDADLALGALGDVADRGGDLPDGVAGLGRRRRHLLRGGRDHCGHVGDLADERVELRHQRGIALELDADLMRLRVEGVRQRAQLDRAAGSSATVEPSSRRSR